jgi:hypothetical protein
MRRVGGGSPASGQRASMWSAPTRSIRSTKARPCWPAPSRITPQRPGAQLRGRLGQRDDATWAAHAAALRLLARQPHRRGDAAERVAASCSPERPPRLRDRLGRVLQRDLLPRRAAAGRPGGGRSWAARLQEPGGLHQPVQAQQRAGLRSAASWPATRADQAFLLYRTYHGSAMSPVVQRPASRPGTTRPMWRQPRAVPRQVRAGHAAAGRRAGRALPDAGFYLWAGVPRLGMTMTAFAAALLAQYNVTVLPGSLPGPRGPGQQPRRRPRAHGAGGRHRRMRGSRPAHRRNSSILRSQNSELPSTPTLPEFSHEPMTQQLPNTIDPPGKTAPTCRPPSTPPKCARPSSM